MGTPYFIRHWTGGDLNLNGSLKTSIVKLVVAKLQILPLCDFKIGMKWKLTCPFSKFTLDLIVNN